MWCAYLFKTRPTYRYLSLNPLKAWSNLSNLTKLTKLSCGECFLHINSSSLPSVPNNIRECSVSACHPSVSRRDGRSRRLGQNHRDFTGSAPGQQHVLVEDRVTILLPDPAGNFRRQRNGRSGAADGRIFCSREAGL